MEEPTKKNGAKFILKIEPGNDVAREYITEKIVEEGLECDGYFFVGFKDGTAKFGSMMNITIEDIMEYLREDGDVASEILQAALIAKGFRDARDVATRFGKKKEAKESFESFMSSLFGIEKKES